MTLSISQARLYYGFLICCIVFQIIFWGLLKKLSDDTHFKAFEILEIYKELILNLNEKAETDKSGRYKIIYSEKENSKSEWDVTLVTQCSTNNLFLINGVMEVWNGSISVAVFSEVHNIEMTVWEMAKYTHCYQFRGLELHLVVHSMEEYPVQDFSFGYKMFFNFDNSMSCGVPQILDDMGNYKSSTPYPVNLLRNVAKKGSSSKYILVIDIDMIPSPNLLSDFLNFTKSRPSDMEKEVYVAPVFEVPLDVPIPKTKAELILSVNFKQARPFYLQPCRNCQKLTRYSDWLLSKPTTGIRVLYEVQWKHPWEPFFIAKRSIPDFDERFKQYGMNRVSQICELYVAGYKFLILDNVFLIHKGYKTIEGFHPTKNKEMINNRRLYTKFKTELKYRYPKSYRSC